MRVARPEPIVSIRAFPHARPAMPSAAATSVRRLARPALAVVLVFAHAAATFGFPLVRPRGGPASACGCVAGCGVNEGCCCKVDFAPPPPPVPVESVPSDAAPRCPKCLLRDAAKSAAVGDPEPAVEWVAAFKARQCRGESPLGLLAEIPAVAPAVPSHAGFAPLPSGVVRVADSHASSHVTALLDPPPRSG